MSVADYPEHERMAAIKDRSQAIGEFLDWAMYKGYHLALWACYDLEHGEPEHDCPKTSMFSVGRGTEDLLAEFFGIDLNKIHDEKDAMLAEIRAMHGR